MKIKCNDMGFYYLFNILPETSRDKIQELSSKNLATWEAVRRCLDQELADADNDSITQATFDHYIQK